MEGFVSYRLRVMLRGLCDGSYLLIDGFCRWLVEFSIGLYVGVLFRSLT